MQEDSLKKRYSVKLFANIISAIIGAIMVAIFPKALGPIAYGQFIYIQEFFLNIYNFLDMSTSTAFFTKLSAKQSRKELMAFYFIYSFIVLLLVFGFIFVADIFGILNVLIPDISIEYIYLGLFFGFFTWATQIFIKISDAYALTVSVELIKIGHKVVSLLLLLFFVYQLAFDLELFFYFHYIALISFLLVITWLFIKKGIFQNILHSPFSILILTKEFIKYCKPLISYNVLGIAIGLFDIWLLQKISGSEQTGFYGLAYSLAVMCFLFTSAMTPILTREFAKYYGLNEIEQIRKLFKKYIPMLYSIAAFFGIFVAFQSENVLMIFTDERFIDAFFVLIVMAFYPIHQTYGQLSGSIFYVTEQTTLYKNIAIVSMVIGMY